MLSMDVRELEEGGLGDGGGISLKSPCAILKVVSTGFSNSWPDFGENKMHLSPGQDIGAAWVRRMRIPGGVMADCRVCVHTSVSGFCVFKMGDV